MTKKYIFMQALKNIIVTGSNKGIGFGIVNHLASQQGWNIIMACRNVELAHQSRAEILARHPTASINLEKLDVSDSKSIDAFLEVVSQKYNPIHVLVNNAGVAVKGDSFDIEGVKWTFQTNFYGTIELTEKILPLLAEKGKIVTLGSTAGKMGFNRINNQDLKQRWKNAAPNKEEIFALMHEFQQAVSQGNYGEKGWPKWGYAISKLGINAYHVALARNPEVIKKGIQVNVCCPGYVKTDMTSHKGALSLEEGILTPVFLIEQPFEVKEQWQGGFFYLCKLDTTFG